MRIVFLATDEHGFHTRIYLMLTTSPALTNLISPVAVSSLSAPSCSTPHVVPCQTSSPLLTRTSLPFAYDDLLDHAATILSRPPGSFSNEYQRNSARNRAARIVSRS